MKSHLTLYRAKHRWLWSCSRCMVVLCTTIPGERPSDCPEKCPVCGSKIERAVPGSETCVCCGDSIPEGRQVCPRCAGEEHK